MAEEFNLSIYNDVYDMSFNQETEEIHIELKEGYYPLSNNVDLSNYYIKTETYNKNEVNSLISNIDVDLSNYYNKSESDSRYKSINYVPNWSELFGKPTTFTPSAHTHTISEVINLQTTLDNKQDVLTEDNVGQFMDLELSTKSTPTSGDTVLARDILTNKAVEIPIESLGGGGSGLELGETSSTAYRGDRGKIAYDHSQATGNPHNTKLEELTDVGSETPSIEDTDVILKKEIAGLWKKLSWSNIKYTLKTYFDSIYAPKAFNLKITTPSSWVTDTISETEVLRIEIPANSLSDSDVLRMPFLMINKVGTAGTIFIRGKLSTSTTMPSGQTDQLFQTAIVPAANQFIGLDRSFIIDDGKIKGFPSAIPSYTISTINSNQILQKPFDRTVTNYLYISIVLANSADKARLEGIQLTNS